MTNNIRPDEGNVDYLQTDPSQQNLSQEQPAAPPNFQQIPYDSPQTNLHENENNEQAASIQINKNISQDSDQTYSNQILENLNILQQKEETSPQKEDLIINEPYPTEESLQIISRNELQNDHQKQVFATPFYLSSAEWDKMPDQKLSPEKFQLLNQELFYLSELIQNEIFAKTEPFKSLNRLNYLLEAHFENVWQLINTPNNEAKPIFYSKVLAPITEMLMNEIAIEQPHVSPFPFNNIGQYMNEILIFFYIIISKFLARDPLTVQLIDIASQIFNWDKSFHLSVCSKFSHDLSMRFDFQKSEDQERVQSEFEWRKNQLKVGDYVDVLREQKVRELSLKGWTRGIVKFKGTIENLKSYQDYDRWDEQQRGSEIVVIQFDQSTEPSSVKLSINDYRFAPLGTFTDDYDWRETLNELDTIDCMDNERDWYKATILQTRNTINDQGLQVKEIFVGFRYYDKDGSKQEDDGRKYFGWSERYDEWYSSGDIQVQRYRKLTYQYIKVESANKQYEKQDFDDREDTIFQTRKITNYVSLRPTLFMRSKIINKALNLFGRRGGFDQICNLLEQASRGEIAVTLPQIFSYVIFMYNTSPLWHRQFLCSFVDRLNNAILSSLSYVNTEANDSNKKTLIIGPCQVDTFDYKMLENMINIYVQPIWRRYNTKEMDNKILGYYQLEIGTALLKLQNLQRRICGLKYIAEAIRTSRNSYVMNKMLYPQEVIEVIRRNQVLQLVFGEGTHFQLVHRSLEILRILFFEKEITAEEIDLIWSATEKQGEQIKLEVYQILLEVLKPTFLNISDQILSHLISKFENKEPSTLIEKDLVILNELSSKSQVGFKKSENIQMKCASFMWKIATREFDYPLSLIKIARKNFQQLTESLDDQAREPYIAQCLDNITQNKLPLQSLKILRKLVQKMNLTSYNKTKRDRQEFVQDLVNSQEIINIIIDDLESYINFANEQIQKGEITAENSKTKNVSPNHLFPHIKNIKSRLSRIRNLLLFAGMPLTSQQISRIWDLLIEKSLLREQDQNLFFNWLKILLEKESKKIMPQQLLIELFRLKIVCCDISLLKHLRVNGLDCIVTLFVMVNELKGNVLDLDTSQQESNWNNNSYGRNYNYNYQTSNANNKSRLNRFRINILPQDLEGIGILWSMMEACDNTNYNLFFMVQRTLINIYTNLSSLIADQTSSIHNAFIQQCFHLLTSIIENQVVSRTPKQRKEAISFVCKTISTFFESTENKGLGDLRTHRQLQKRDYLTKLIFETKIPIIKYVDANFIEVNCHNNLSIWELKLLLAQFTSSSPLSIGLKRSNANKPEIKDHNNSKTLFDLLFEDQEQIHIVRYKEPEIVKFPLVDKQGKMVPELKQIIKDWFKQFSVPITKDELFQNIRIVIQEQNSRQSEGAQFIEEEEFISKLEDLDDNLRIMYPKQCALFVETITTVREIGVDDYRVVNLFNNYCHRIGFKMLLESEFLGFYEDQAKNKPETVQSNLENYGIMADLKQKIDHSSLNFENDSRVVIDKSILPRCKLASDQALFEQLLNLVNRSQCDEFEGIWSMIMSIQTNPGLFESVLSLKKFDELFSLPLLDKSLVAAILEGLNIYKILYTIQILKSLIEEYKSKNQDYATLFVEQRPVQQPEQIQEISSQIQPINTQLYNREFPGLNVADIDSPDIYNEGGQTINHELNYNNSYNSKGLTRTEDEDTEGAENETYVTSLPSSRAIPLPYHGPLAPQTTYDIPLAPQSAASMIGAPNASNTQTYFTSLNDFKGQTIRVGIQNQISHSPQDLERIKNFLPQFLKIGGLSMLIKLFMGLARFNSQLSQDLSKQINERILKICLSEIMEIIKELLTAQFCASQNPFQETNDIEKNLPIKTKVEDKKNDKKEKVNQFLEDMLVTEKAMQPLIQFLKRNKQDFIPQFSGQFEVELPSFQKELLGVVCDFISKDKTESEDIEIVKQGLNIWLSCLSSQPQLIKEVFHLSGDDSKFSNMLIEKGLLSSDYKVRDVFHYAIMYICQNLQEITLYSSGDTNQSFTLVTFFLNLLIQKIEYICTKNQSKHTRRFFELLIYILEKTFEIESQEISSIQQLSIDHQQFSLKRNASLLVKQIVNQLLVYQSTESRNSVIEDYTLGGFFNVTRILLSNCPQALEDGHLNELAEMLLDKCLFCFDFKAMPTHITADIDLEPFEKSKLSKCLTSQSTQSCFNLLVTICKINQDKNLIFKILAGYWHKIIYKVDKPSKPGFYPAQNGRSLHGYCGLYNLGAVCYMNSMNQQFYAVPQLRYGLMAAEDQQPENKVLTDAGYEVDDNALHQLQKIFGFLQLSDRQYRNPLDFCFAFKQFDGQPTNVREQRDAQEFLSQVFDRVDTQLKNTSQKYLLANVFGGKTCSMLRCTNCGNLRQTLEDFYNLSLEVKNQSSVQESLRKFIQGEIISDYNCEACKKKVELEKKVCIEQSPNTLIIHLQRIIFDYDSLRNVKLNDRVEFPEVLNLYEFTTSQVLQNTKRMMKKNSQNQNQENQKEEDHKKNDDDGIIAENIPKKEEDRQLSEEENQSENEEEITEGKKNQKKMTEEDFEYRLVGVICHMGSAEAGHYISYVNVERDQDFAKGQTQEVSREEFKDTKAQKWLEFNDSTVSIFKASTQLEQTCFGSIGNNQNAYMLVYEKRMKQKMKLVVPNQLVQWAYLYDQAHPQMRDELAALACDGTAIPRDQTEILQSAIVSYAQTHPQAPGTHLLHAFPKVLLLSLKHASIALQQQQLFKNQNQIQDLSDQDFYYDSKNDEIIAKIDFFDTRKFIPNHIYKDVHEDNLKFLSEKQVFQNGFYECTLELAKMALDHVSSTPQLQQDPGERANRIDMIFGILERVVFDLLANSKQNQSLKAATNLLIELLDQSDDAIFYLIKKRIFIQKEMLMKDERDFFETLATHQNQEVREMASTILQFVIKKLVQIGGSNNLDICKQALIGLLDLMPNECQKHWLRLDTYFNFFYNILNLSPQILHLMLELRAPARLIDLISRYNSNQMVYNQTVPPFDKLVLSLSFMVRSIPCLVDPYDSNNFELILKQFENNQDQYPDRETLLKLATEKRIQFQGTSNLNIREANKYDLQIDEVLFIQDGVKDQQIQLSTECQRGIFYKTKESKVFLENITKNTYEIQELAKMFAHLCFENKDYTQRIAKYILKGTNTSSAEELGPYLEIMKQFLILKDSLTIFRLELIFGVSNFIIKTQPYQSYGSVNNVIKSGVAAIDNIYGQITKYFSPAFKTTGISQYGGKDCAMQALLNNKRSQSKAVLYSLKCILECIIDHNHLELLQYLRAMDPPSYQFARYWDWIKIWVANEVDSNTKNQKLPAFFNELELSITVLNQIEQIENLQNIKTGANYNEGVITYPQDDSGPKPYVIWEIQSAEILDRQKDEQYNINVQLNQIHLGLAMCIALQ